jgi:ferredoxin-NADP reductase
MVTLPILEVLPATPRARIVRLDVGGASFDYAPGQAVLVAAAGGPKRRPYSIAATPEDTRRDGWLELLVGLNDEGYPGPHLNLETGAMVDVEGPLGSFTFPTDPEERRFAFIAGGTGIAPLRAMLHRALTIPHREIGLFYTARTPAEFAYEEELLALARAGRIDLRRTVTRGGGETWDERRGRICREDLQPLVHDPATLCFVCGPRSLVHEMSALLQELSVPRRRIRVEEWSG